MPLVAMAAEERAQVHFAHGVASGDPLTDRVIIWTRISGTTAPVEGEWEVAEDEAFKKNTARGRFVADSTRDHTVKIDVTGLRPGTSYFYRFRAEAAVSPTGRTKTLPSHTDRLVLVAASCAMYPNGYFNAYRAIADLDELDVVVFLGDYIYEYGADPDAFGMDNGIRLGRIPDPPHEIISLDDYRRRHAQCRTESELQAAHARAAWICVFDDHEVANNPWTDGAENHNPDQGDGDWTTRKTCAIRAWREWMPIRDPAPGHLSEAIYRSFRFGHLVELTLLETRLLARSRQLDYANDMPTQDGAPDIEAFRNRLNDPRRELMGAEQRDWLAACLASSVQAGVRWQLLGSQVIMARVNSPNYYKVFGLERVNSTLAALAPDEKAGLNSQLDLFTKSNPLPYNLDAWDGYPAERERLFEMVNKAKARLIVVSGDSHCAWANHLSDQNGQPVGVEIGVTAITSPTHWPDPWFPDFELTGALAAQSDEVVAADDRHNGFARLTITRNDVRAEWMAVSTIASRDFTLSTRRTFRLTDHSHPQFIKNEAL
ncbi:alkaline phosphatase D family protein [Asticcacaulis sp. MM231]|uniref:alkaline phosphatase D family protein n=1 Tax=Asticcacaulis sp. MM231 TaxID=3157666 RepID=UPI0032D592CE